MGMRQMRSSWHFNRLPFATLVHPTPYATTFSKVLLVITDLSLFAKKSVTRWSKLKMFSEYSWNSASSYIFIDRNDWNNHPRTVQNGNLIKFIQFQDRTLRFQRVQNLPRPWENNGQNWWKGGCKFCAFCDKFKSKQVIGIVCLWPWSFSINKKY